MKVLAEIADIYPRMTSIHDSSLFDGSFAMDFINHGDKIIYCAMYLYIGYVNEATNFAESQGGGGSDTKDWGREKDEDEIEWIRRCLRQATRMVKPRRGKGLNPNKIDRHTNPLRKVWKTMTPWRLLSHLQRFLMLQRFC